MIFAPGLGLGRGGGGWNLVVEHGLSCVGFGFRVEIFAKI